MSNTRSQQSASQDLVFVWQLMPHTESQELQCSLTSHFLFQDQMPEQYATQISTQNFWYIYRHIPTLAVNCKDCSDYTEHSNFTMMQIAEWYIAKEINVKLYATIQQYKRI